MFFYLILGISGMMSILGMLLFFVVPGYIILGNFNFGNDERLVISFFIGVGIFPAIAYWLGMFVSFRISIFIALILLFAAWAAARKFIKLWQY